MPDEDPGTAIARAGSVAPGSAQDALRFDDEIRLAGLAAFGPVAVEPLRPMQCAVHRAPCVVDMDAVARVGEVRDPPVRVPCAAETRAARERNERPLATVVGALAAAPCALERAVVLANERSVAVVRPLVPRARDVYAARWRAREHPVRV